MTYDGGFTDVQVSWVAYWECGTCGAHDESEPMEYPDFEPDHDCEATE
ncbi:hypothetical protein ACIQVT_34485 [Streptomyces sp. NPDC100445]